jgi:hypothetical protein
MQKNILRSGIIFTLLLSSCHSTDKHISNEAKSISATHDMEADVFNQKQSTYKAKSANKPNEVYKSEQKKIIKTGYLNIKSSNIYHSKSSFDKILKKVDGYYELEKLYSDDNSSIYDLTIRVPSANFEKLLYEIESGKNEITDKNISGNDVTEEFYDLETRLVSKHEYLKRYRAILTKANTIEEILLIEEKIREIEEEIDSKEGRLKFLKDQIGFSTLSIHLFDKKVQKIIEYKEDGFFTKAGNSISNGLNSILNLILWLISIWPYIFIVILTYYISRRFVKNKTT